MCVLKYFAAGVNQQKLTFSFDENLVSPQKLRSSVTYLVRMAESAEKWRERDRQKETENHMDETVQ